MAYRVLLVDDSAAMRAFIRRVLDLCGLEIEALFEAGDGREALELLEREWVDVILTDINMPGMDGEEFIQRLASSGAANTTPIIVVSTDATTARREHLLQLGARGYLVKPFAPETLQSEIERVLGGSHA
ncbi:MAG TPA: response regulator [Bryobacteraceae bacterium]|jgi:two-component system chemotaxis response regulator CheY